ncbi:unnamed protein product [Coregonus sp. 'balchen']|nr:unnamed protein product [Coregonus sp. 'balchen']
MAVVKRPKRVAASQSGFISLKSSADSDDLNSGRRMRVNKKKELEQTQGLISEKPDDSLFFVDIGEQRKSVQPEVQEGKKSKSRPLRIDLILQHDSLVPPPKDVLAHQQPNAKKLCRIGENAERLAAMGVLPRRQKRLLNRRPATTTHRQQILTTLSKQGKGRPEKLNAKPSILPAVEVIAPGGSYNPDFFSHQALLLEAHEVEVKREKAELRIERQLAVNREDTATEETVFQEQVEGLVEDDEEEDEEEEDVSIRGGLQQEKKTEKERMRERTDKIKLQQKQAARAFTDKKQQLFQLRSIQATLKRREQRTRERVAQRKANQEAEKSMPRRLGRLKFQAQDLEIQLSDEIPGSLRTLKSMQKRNMIEPRERAKFKRRHKVKYVEKRAFKEIT